MVLRITRDDATAPTVTLKLEGHLLRAFAGLVEHECSVLCDSPGGVALDLSGVTIVDSSGVQALGRLHRKGVAIGGCSELIASILEAEGIVVDRD